ncbi:MAG: hypothetical protein AAFZ91_08330 [Pseudomonadota bacterium]
MSDKRSGPVAHKDMARVAAPHANGAARIYMYEMASEHSYEDNDEI